MWPVEEHIKYYVCIQIVCPDVLFGRSGVFMGTAEASADWTDCGMNAIVNGYRIDHHGSKFCVCFNWIKSLF